MIETDKKINTKLNDWFQLQKRHIIKGELSVRDS